MGSAIGQCAASSRNFVALRRLRRRRLTVGVALYIPLFVSLYLFLVFFVRR